MTPGKPDPSADMPKQRCCKACSMEPPVRRTGNQNSPTPGHRRQSRDGIVWGEPGSGARLREMAGQRSRQRKHHRAGQQQRAEVRQRVRRQRILPAPRDALRGRGGRAQQQRPRQRAMPRSRARLQRDLQCHHLRCTDQAADAHCRRAVRTPWSAAATPSLAQRVGICCRPAVSKPYLEL